MYLWIDEYLLSKPGVTKDLQENWNWIRYHVGGKMFAAICLEDGTNRPYFINVKHRPEDGEAYRAQYRDIIPGYYSNKMHWSSIKAEGKVPNLVVRDMLDQSYDLVLHGLSKRMQKQILDAHAAAQDGGQAPEQDG